MGNVPNKSRLNKIPVEDKLIYLHFFIGSSDWYVAEHDGEDTFLGYVILNGDIECAEWGHFSFSDLKVI